MPRRIWTQDLACRCGTAGGKRMGEVQSRWRRLCFGDWKEGQGCKKILWADSARAARSLGKLSRLDALGCEKCRREGHHLHGCGRHNNTACFACILHRWECSLHERGSHCRSSRCHTSRMHAYKGREGRGRKVGVVEPAVQAGDSQQTGHTGLAAASCTR